MRRVLTYYVNRSSYFFLPYRTSDSLVADQGGEDAFGRALQMYTRGSNSNDSAAYFESLVDNDETCMYELLMIMISLFLWWLALA